MEKPELCFTLLNHWSYTGIGWCLGLESCAQSIADSLDMADYEPSVKTGINLDALTYELVATHYPPLIRRLQRYLDAGQVEIIGGTFGQPIGSMVSGESNLRQLVVGQETITRVLGRPVAVFLEEEEMTHPQIPQLLALAGYRYASLAQCDTWGRHGAPVTEDAVVHWEGADGTRVPAVPHSRLVLHPPMVTPDLESLWTEEGRATVARMTPGRTPLVLKWTEFGWEKLGGKSINKFDPVLFKEFSQRFRVEYLTVEQYLERQLADPKAPPVPTRRWTCDDFNKLLPWGIGADQLRRFGREVEGVLLAAERFEAVAHLLGLGVDEAPALYAAWRQLLAAQSHDVSLCEYTRHQGATPPADPELDTHFQTWGSYGYRYMDEAVATGRTVLQHSLQALARQINTAAGGRPALRAAAVFNPCGFARDAIASTGRLDLEEFNVAHLQVSTATGAPVPAQVVAGTRGADGYLVSAEVIFPAVQLPSVGYDTFHLAPASSPATAATDLRVDSAAFTLENEFLRVTLDPVSGAIARLQDRRSGRDFLAHGARPFPTLTGEANGDSPLAKPLHTPVPPYDTAKTQAQFTWLETGPVRARVRAAQPDTRGLRFETTVGLAAGTPHVDVQVRVFADLPPKPGEAKINGWQFPLEITEGYWLELTPAFAVATAQRDYPFGAEAATKTAVTALSWLDLQAADGSGLLLVHGGTQYFKRRENGAWANLILREWESHFTGEYGWARTSAHRYQLRPHLAALAPAAATEAALAFDQPARCVVLPPAPGTWAPRRSFVAVEGGTLSALRHAPDRPGVCELRVAESSGQAATATVTTTLPLQTRRPTDALGRPRGAESPLALTTPFTLHPWEIKQFELA